MILKFPVLINRLRDHTPCRRTIGHGETCQNGHECEACRVRLSVADELEQFSHRLRKLDNSNSFYRKAVADPQGLETGAVRDGIEWLLEAVEEVTKHA